MSNFKEGQEVFVSLRSMHRMPIKLESKKITKIGTKWVYVGFDRFDKVSRDFEYNHGRFIKIYLSQEEFDEEQKVERAFEYLRDMFRNAYSPPKGMTSEQLLHVIDHLGKLHEFESRDAKK